MHNDGCIITAYLGDIITAYLNKRTLRPVRGLALLYDIIAAAFKIRRPQSAITTVISAVGHLRPSHLTAGLTFVCCCTKSDHSGLKSERSRRAIG